jgi:hypothetical protein
MRTAEQGCGRGRVVVPDAAEGLLERAGVVGAAREGVRVADATGERSRGVSAGEDGAGVADAAGEGGGAAKPGWRGRSRLASNAALISARSAAVLPSRRLIRSLVSARVALRFISPLSGCRLVGGAERSKFFNEPETGRLWPTTNSPGTRAI